ncbi:MAG: gluconate 2-dehydrogenase subunit 3 family protein [Solirubrobacterales bacterium]|nr:gluconate 2-dehydrogenase subunit 3 family protein [Solirubrobacterales bacterium]
MAHSFQTGEHLPHNRPEGDPPDPQGLPRQRAGVTPQMHGRFPDFDVMAHREHWDPVTRRTLEERVAQVPACRFFDEREQRTLGAFLDVVLAQDSEPRIPVLQMVDKKMADGKLDGYRFDDMPPDPETWKRVARHLDGFAERSDAEQHEVVRRFSGGELDWDDLNVSRAWSVVMRGALSEFYSHPWAFNEIGFRGPAYPRGYMRRNMGPTGVDPDEPQEAFGLDPVRDLQQRSA